MASTYLVTGAAGFIGSHVTDRLLERGDRVVGLDNFDDFYDPGIKRANLRRWDGHEAFRLVEGDIRDRELVRRLMAAESVDVLVHLAARAGVRPSLEQPELYADVNVRGTTVLLEAARQAGVRRVIYASSSSVYGGNEKVPFSEDDPVDHPVSPYAATKKACEVIAHTFHHLYGLDTIGLRFFTVYGPRQRPEMAIHKFTRLIDQGRPVPMFGDGSSERDYTYIDDIVAGVLAAIDAARGCRVYNLGESATISLADLVALIGRALGREPQIERRPFQPGDVLRTWADVSRARRELGYDPQVPVEEGIERFVRWYRESAP
ncbi:MAG: GDP-mannose 4,6-dehydratase [Acidobacteriota bacterium]|nr:GDP-mannose 4,6-dehydratase [Acidobacteriota bacterium]MDQ7088590.1 GDP-mannose 4,6-dehydratase [Acidobacteriota bacterium]